MFHRSCHISLEMYARLTITEFSEALISSARAQNHHQLHLKLSQLHMKARLN
jgi:hypothetical protein